MRISDWSSDVCSSDLEGVYINADGAPASGSRPASEFPPLMMSDLSSFIPGGVFSGGSSRRDRFYRDGQLVPLGPDVQTGQPINIGTTDDGNSGYFLPNRDDRKSTRLNSSHSCAPRMPSSA